MGAVSTWLREDEGETSPKNQRVRYLPLFEKNTPHNVPGNLESGFQGCFNSLWKLATSCHLFIGSKRVGDGNCFNTWHRNTHASWLLGFVWAGGSSLRGWQGGNTQPGQEIGLLTLAVISHLWDLGQPQILQPKGEGHKTEEPRGKFFKLWSSIVV